MKTLLINEKSLVYNDSGNGVPIILLHGYLETKEIWEDLAKKLALNFRVIVPDIPGHGKSEQIAEIHSMELMADCIHKLLTHLKISACIMVGHSMGGYIALAFAHKYTSMLLGTVLFHSSVFADTDEKKAERLHDIACIEQGKLKQIVDTHMPKIVAEDSLSCVENQIDKLKEIALKHPAKGVCALLRGIMERPDRQAFLSALNQPFLFIFGSKDRFISMAAAESMRLINPLAKTAWLPNSGHTGFIEEPELALLIIENFCSTVSSKI